MTTTHPRPLDSSPTTGVQDALFDVENPDGPAALPGQTVGYRGPQVCQITGVTYRQLDYWTRTNLIHPSVAEATGSGSQRLYGFRDLVIIKIIKGLLDTGISLQNVRKALVQLDQLDATELSGINLFSDGKTVYQCRSAEEVIDLLAGGQGVFGIAVPGLVAQLTGDLTSIQAHTAGEESALAGDELAARRAARTA